MIEGYVNEGKKPFEIHSTILPKFDEMRREERKYTGLGKKIKIRCKVPQTTFERKAIDKKQIKEAKDKRERGKLLINFKECHACHSQIREDVVAYCPICKNTNPFKVMV